MVIQVSVPEGGRENAGVLVASPEQCVQRFRRDLAELDPENADILEELASDLAVKAQELGPAGLLDWLEDTASNYIAVTDREPLAAGDPEKALPWFYHRNVRPPVRKFRTHLPLFSVEAAAGRWGPERDVEAEPEDWIEAPESLRRLTEDMFVARVRGRSMEPLIPDGSLCVFRGGAALAGSRQGKRLLIANFGEPGDQRFTVKVYESIKQRGGEDEFAHRKIILHPLNPEYPSWELDHEPADFESSGRIRVVGEFVCVLKD
jgi:SOS-response transcriptional repressor LexA